MTGIWCSDQNTPPSGACWRALQTKAWQAGMSQRPRSLAVPACFESWSGNPKNTQSSRSSHWAYQTVTQTGRLIVYPAVQPAGIPGFQQAEKPAQQACQHCRNVSIGPALNHFSPSNTVKAQHSCNPACQLSSQPCRFTSHWKQCNQHRKLTCNSCCVVVDLTSLTP
jgi:hypothetical protein